MPIEQTVPHTALVYANKRDRNKLLESVIERADAKWNVLKILSSEPRADGSFFKRKTWKTPQRGGKSKPRIQIVDVGQLLVQTTDPVGDIMSVIESPSGRGRRQLVIGDWLHRVYDEFDVGIAVEDAEARAGRRNLICCYRGEGFWSLDCKYISRMFELHNEVLFDGTVFRMSG